MAMRFGGTNDTMILILASIPIEFGQIAPKTPMLSSPFISLRLKNLLSICMAIFPAVTYQVRRFLFKKSFLTRSMAKPSFRPNAIPLCTAG